MSQRENRVADSHFSGWGEASSRHDEVDLVASSSARTRAMEEVGHRIARQLNGPLTALLLYMEELKQHSHRLSQGADEPPRRGDAKARREEHRGSGARRAAASDRLSRSAERI